MPEAVEKCVQSRLADSDFKAPESYEGDRKSFAYALCTSLHNKGQLQAGEAAVVTIEGQTYYSTDDKVWLQASMAFEAPTDVDLEKMNRLSAALTPGSIIKFKDAVLVRAEVNKNQDEVDEQGIREIASTLPLKPIDKGHKHQSIVGMFIDAAPVEGDTAVSTSGLIFAGRFPEIARDLVSGNGHLSVDARAESALCRECGGVYKSQNDYCAHINRDAGGRAVRKLQKLESDGGAIVPNPAGNDTHIPQQGLVMIAHLEGGSEDVTGEEPGLTGKKPQRNQGGAHVEELERVQADLKAKAEELEVSQGENKKMSDELEELRPKLEAAETDRDSEKETREAAEKERDKLQGELDKIKLQARLEKVMPFLGEEELEEQKEVISAMADDAFNLMLASVQRVEESTGKKKSGTVLIGQEDGTKTPVVWAA